MNIKDMLSDRVTSLPPSGIRKFFDIVSEMKDAISLGVGEPDFVTPWHIREAGIYSLEKGRTIYTANAGLMELRKEISKYLLRRFDIEYNPNNEIVVTIGGSEAIDNAVRAIISPGDEVLIPEPSFVCYKPCAVLAGGTPVPITTTAENGFKLTAEQLRKSITPKSKLLILPYPNNPTGGIMEKADLEAIADVIRDKNIMVISDEIYAELTYRGNHTSFASISGMWDRTITINGFSKAYAMTGWRLGYAAGHKDVIAQITKIHQYAIMSAPTTSQYAAIEALKNGDEDIAFMKNDYSYRRKLMLDGVRNIGMDCFEPFGAFYVFPSIKKTGMSSNEFCERLLEEYKVAVVPGTAFGESGEGHVRMSYCYSIKTINEALLRISKFFEKYGG